MALFGRQKNNRTPGGSSLGIPGRKLSSSLSVADCEQLFRSLCAQQGGYTEFAVVDWKGADAPALLIAALQNGRPALYFAAWDRGSQRELNLVPATDPAQLPAPMIGGWKMQDSSLSSTGTVTSFPVG